MRCLPVRVNLTVAGITEIHVNLQFPSPIYVRYPTQSAQLTHHSPHRRRFQCHGLKLELAHQSIILLALTHLCFCSCGSTCHSGTDQMSSHTCPHKYSPSTNSFHFEQENFDQASCHHSNPSPYVPALMEAPLSGKISWQCRSASTISTCMRVHEFQLFHSLTPATRMLLADHTP